MRILISVILLLLTLGFLGDGSLWPAQLAWLPAMPQRLLIVALFAGLLLLVWGLPKLWRRWQQRGQASDEELYFRREKAHIRSHLKDLRQHLRRQFRGGANPYHLPWIMVIGPEKGGSSRWLTGAGFEPICRKEETRNAEVQLWLSEQAVAIEVSSVLLQQENSLLEKPIWDYLLQQLCLHRPRQPISAMLLMLDARRLQGATEGEMEQLIQHYRRRAVEVRQQCSLEPPLLLQVTQADQLDGFDAYSAALGASDRQQPWGFVVDEQGNESFQDALHGWQLSIAQPLLTLLQNQTALPARQSLMRFVLQLELVQQRLATVYQGLAQGDRFGPGIALRGCFLSSAGQQGAAQPWLARQLVSAQFDCASPAPQLPGQEAIFINQQVPKVLQPLSARLGQNPLAAAGWRLSTLATGLLLVGLLAGSFQVYWLNVSHNKQLETGIEQALLRYETDVADTGPDQITPLIMPLSELRMLVEEVNQPRPWYLSVGLFDQQLADQITRAYHNQLAQRLLPVLAKVTESNLAAYVHLSDADGVFEHLQHYLMLHDIKLREAPALTAYLLRSLLAHEEILGQDRQPLTTLFADLWQTAAVPKEQNTELVAEARIQLDRIIDERLVYDYIRSRPALARTVDMRERLSGQFSQVFTFSEGYEGYYVPRLFTRDGYNSLDLSSDSALLKDAINRLEQVKTGKLKASYATRSRISDRVRELYFADYVRRWREFIRNIELRTAAGSAELDTLLDRLYRGETPVLYQLTALIAAQTQLVEEKPPADNSAAQKAAEKKVAKALKIKGPAKKALSNAASDRLAKLAAQRNASIVNHAFASYASLYAERGEAINLVLTGLQETRQQLSSHADPDFAAWELVRQINQGKTNVLDELDSTSRLLPRQVQEWFGSLEAQVWEHWLVDSERYLQSRWEDEVYSEYQQRLAGRFPLVAGARREVRPGTLASFLRPQGRLDAFFDDYLSAFVESRGRTWSVRGNKRRALAISAQYLASQQYLRRIQSALFANEGGQLDIRYNIRPEQLSTNVTTFGLRDGLQQLEYRHGPRQWQAAHWPVQDANPDLTLYFENNGLRLAQQQFRGPWALWRFAYASEQFPVDDGVQLHYSLRDYQIRLGVQLEGSANPFDPALLSKLNLPRSIIARGD